MSGMLQKILFGVALLLLSAFGCAVAQQPSPDATEKPVPYQVGQWQSSDRKVLNQWWKAASGKPMTQTNLCCPSFRISRT